MKKYIPILKRTQMFAGVGEKDIATMLSCLGARVYTYKKGEYVLRQGEHINDITVLVEGSLHIQKDDYWGNRSILSNVSAGHIFAETYALSREPLMVDVVSAEDCEVLFLNLSALTDPLYANDSWQRKFMKNILNACVQKNQVLSNRIFCTTPKSTRARILTYLSYQAVKEGRTTFRIPFNRQQMADYLNLDRSALSKELGRMRDEGILEFRKNQFTLTGIQLSP